MRELFSVVTAYRIFRAGGYARCINIWSGVSGKAAGCRLLVEITPPALPLRRFAVPARSGSSSARRRLSLPG